MSLQEKASLFIDPGLLCAGQQLNSLTDEYICSSPSNSSSAVAYDCADILNATTSPSSTEQEVEEQQQDSVSDDDAYENAKLNCMLKAITSR